MKIKKKEELGFLKGALDILGINYTSIIPGEKPDFTLYFSKKIIGVEVTKYFRDKTKKKKGSILKKNTEDWKKLVYKIEEKLKNTNNAEEGKYANLILNPTVPPPLGKEREYFIKAFIKYFEKPSKNTSQFDILKKYLYGLPDIRIKKTLYCKNRINLSEFSAYNFKIKRLIEKIKEKDEKVKNYKKYNNLWLLIVSGLEGSQLIPRIIDIENKIKNSDLQKVVKDSKFNNIYFYIKSRKRVYKLIGGTNEDSYNKSGVYVDKNQHI
jgi:hypothetical protein